VALSYCNDFNTIIVKFVITLNWYLHS